MRKLAVVILGTLLMTSNVFADNVTLDPQALAKSIMNPGNATTASDKGRFNIVYGGQDISRTNTLGNSPVFVG